MKIRLVELVRTVILDRVVEWHRAEIVGIFKGKGRAVGRVKEAAVAARGAGRDADVPEEAVGAGRVPAKGEKVYSVWPLLVKAGHGDAHKCLKKVRTTYR